LFEAIILCVIGGSIGLFMVWITSLILTNILEFEFVLSIWNIIIGSGLSIIVGIVSGIIPAITASKLDPVEAIRTGM
jgi:putative ABC transport system permease protein